MSESEGVEERFYRHRPVAADLRGLVTGVYAYTGGRASRETIVEAASLTIPLIVNLGAPYGIGLGRKPGGDDRHGSFVAGLFAGPVWIELQRGLRVRAGQSDPDRGAPAAGAADERSDRPHGLAGRAF